ncbi:MAG: hypothetical protein SGILL_006642, partial [Bacillariaceae sp.]
GIILALALARQIATTTAHTRLECPPPRSGETGNKVGPCDVPDDDLALEAFPLKPNAFNTITWLESISHPGAPARLALSLDGSGDDGYESCILLDHIPHDERSRPSFLNERTWHRSSITVYIPDIYCERCHLQLMTVMSDEGHGVPAGTSCAYAAALKAGTVDSTVTAEGRQQRMSSCPVVYHSCAPVSINGTIPRNEIDMCDTADFEQRLKWPFSEKEEKSVYFYKGNPGIYSKEEARLVSGGFPVEDCDNLSYCSPDEFYQERIAVPDDAEYSQLTGTCADIVNMRVEPFVFGKLPNMPMNETGAGEPIVDDEIINCAVCEPLGACFSVEACFLRDTISGNWTGEAELCNQFAFACEECFLNSTCYMGAGAPLDNNGEEPMAGQEESSQPQPSPSPTEEMTSDAVSSRIPSVLVTAMLIAFFGFLCVS